MAQVEEEKPQFKIVWGENYLALPRDPQPWLIEKLIPSGGGSALLYGKPKLGKSYAALGMAQAIADEKVDQWLGHRVLKHGKVVYLQVDTPREEWAMRVEKLKSRGDITKIGFVDAQLCPYPLDLNVAANKIALRERIEADKPVLVVIDTLREVHNGDENKAEPMKEIITSIAECTRTVGASILFVAHSRKDNPNIGDDLMNDNRGNSYTVGRMDVIAKLTEKQMFLKGRSLRELKMAVEQDALGFIQLNAEKQEIEADIKFVMEQPNITDRQRAEMLAGMSDIELETARSRIKRYKQRLKDGE